MDLWRAVAVRPEHGWNGLAAGFALRDAWHALNDTRFFHECGIELRGDSADHRAIVTREARIRWSRRRSAPKMVRCVGQEVDLGLVKE